MEFTEVIEKRYSVRGYLPNPVEDEKLQAVLNAARLAPTAANRQPFQIIVAHTARREGEIQRIYRESWFVQAPLVICGCVIHEQGWVRRDQRSYTDVDIAIVMDHLILAATNLGLGTCWIASFDIQAARQIFGIPNSAEPVIVTPLGYPALPPHAKERKPLENLVRYEYW